MNCVACAKPLSKVGKTRRCDCGAAWVPEAVLVEMTNAASRGIVAIPWKPRKGDSRACPVCDAAMTAVSVKDVALDRCEKHGVWFDAEELQCLLKRAKKFPAAEVASGSKQTATKPSRDVEAVDGAGIDGSAIEGVLSILGLLAELF
jgi:Zn-finger nucleic acid-binding protein